jgi:glycosyltransferase involved in cell wall biosynthesis
MASEDSQSGLTIFFPVYNDEQTVRTVTEKAICFLRQNAESGEVIIIDDGSPDDSGVIADRLAAEHPCVRAIHHPRNLGYGEALKTGFREAKYEWICFTDGDDEYDIFDFERLLKHKDYYDLVITFRYVKLYSTARIFVSWIYNWLVRRLFRVPYRDVSTGLRAVRRSLIQELSLESDSPFIGAEIAIKTRYHGFRVGEVGIQTFPRTFGRGATVTPRNILATIRDMLRIHRRVFSDEYQLPPARSR